MATTGQGTRFRQFNLQQMLIAMGLFGCTLAFATYQPLLAVAFISMISIGSIIAGGLSGKPTRWRIGGVYGFIFGATGLLIGYFAVRLMGNGCLVATPASTTTACVSAAAGGLLARWRNHLAAMSRLHWGVVLALLLVSTTVAAGWLAHRIHVVRIEEEAVALIIEAGGKVEYNGDSESAYASTAELYEPKWELYRRWLGLRPVVRVSICHCDAGGIMPAVSNLRNLERLDLGACRLADDHLHYLTPLKYLRIVNLSENQLSGHGVRLFSQCPHLERLNLSRTLISGESIEALASLRQVRHLGLNDTLLSDAEAERLRSLLPQTLIDHNVSPIVAQQAELEQYMAEVGRRRAQEQQQPSATRTEHGN